MTSNLPVEKVKTKVWGGIIFLILYHVMIVLITKSITEKNQSDFDFWDSIQKGFGVILFLSMFIYAFVVKRFHFGKNKKRFLLLILFVFLNVGGYYLGKYYYRTSPTIYQTNQYMEQLNAINTSQKNLEIILLRKTIDSLNMTINEAPKDVNQINNFINAIDTLIKLHKKSYDITCQVYNTNVQSTIWYYF